jgi:hypothetical protein
MQAQTLFLERLPRRPYCSDNLEAGLRIRPTQTALRYRHIQPNPPLAVAWLVFDIDYDYPQAALRWDMPNHPPPTITVVNPQNGHAHLVYGLNTPVAMSDTAKDAPIRYAAAIQAAFRARLGADNGYAGLIAKNPLHPDWQVEWVNKLYDLCELAEYVSLPKRIPARESFGLGRNCTLFDELRAWAYQWIRVYKKNGASQTEWHGAIRGQAESLNQFEAPLSFSEVHAIAKSVSKWVWQHFSDVTFSALQSARGKRGGRPKTTTKDGKPWERAGLSRATYYRQVGSGLLLPSQ